MSSPEQQQIINFFHEVLEQPAEQRNAYIDRRHSGNPELIDRLNRLLAGHLRAEQASEDTADIATANTSIVDDIPDWIGPYRVLEVIGEGGMGVVYAAEQIEPIRRRVAIKVIKLGMDTKEVIARFEAERQALAMLDHPSVAKVFDAGSTQIGRPYFVMELVKGLSLTEYCFRHKLSLKDRLRLFMRVCDAVRHAHQRGIIHRDLKPSNVLVAAPDGHPVPKVIDFGVAKATASRLSERTVFTEQGKLIGTPEYMSPEQAEMSGLDVDIRTDIYSLGVLLYELLTGVLPFDSATLRSGGYAEIQRIIREVDPPLPSARLTELARQPSAPTSNMATAAKNIRGELDWIVMRAIEKDRTRRYESASALFLDIERYLADKPVLAGPPSPAYKLRKFVKRHRFMTFVMASALAAAVAGVSGLTIGLINAREAQELADRRADNAIVAAGFLQKVLFHVDPENGGGKLSLQQVFDIASRSVGEDLNQYPEVEASVRESIGVAYRRLSMYAQAEPHLRRSLEIRRNLLGEDDLLTARSFIAMAYLVFEHEGKIDESLSLLEQARAGIESNGLRGSPFDAWALLDVGLISLAGDRLAEAKQAFTECAELLTKQRGADHPDLSRPLRGLALVQLGYGDRELAKETATKAVRKCEGEGTEYIGARAKLALARVLLELGETEQVSQLLTEARTQFARTVTPRHIRMTELDACLCKLYLTQHAFTKAAMVADRCASVRTDLLDRNHWAILDARLLKQRALIGLGQAEAAESELLEIGEAAERLLPNHHPLTIAIARARLECARALNDESLIAIRRERLERMEAQRAARLKATPIKQGS